ncbi:MAG TPA: nicotinamide riboside transporter PnuC [Steroidobacteraceae bacterium]|nr:nicotinamide riboside transporter PnuC [Steroidobacteraceae bacterium]
MSAWHEMSWIELLAAALALAYVRLAIGQRLSCWAAAFTSSVLYVWVYFTSRLFMESALNVFFAAMAVYGFWQWQHGRGGGTLQVTRWPLARHALALLGIVAAAAVNAYFLARFTPAANPFIDSMVTWSSVFTTFLVARKVYENWYWWLAIDSVCVCLYFTRHLYLTMLLYTVYVVLCVIGMREWRRSLPIAAYAAA